MKKRICNSMQRVAMSVLAVMIAWVMAPGARSWAGELASIPLPPPQTDGGKPLMQALGLKDNQVILLAQCVGRPAP
jgi:hypothetical protein